MPFVLGFVAGAGAIVGSIIAINTMFELADRRHRD